MRKSYLKQLLTYINILVFMLKIISFNRLEHLLKKGKLKKILSKKTKLPYIDAIKRSSSDFDLDGLKEIHTHIIETTVKIRYLKMVL